LKFCNDEGILITDYDYLPKDSYTFTSSAHNTMSWLDHILTTSTGIPRIDWSSIDSPSIDGYNNKTTQLLCNITLDYDMLSFNEISCNNSDHN